LKEGLLSEEKKQKTFIFRTRVRLEAMASVIEAAEE
jgi:hypothetical protein